MKCLNCGTKYEGNYCPECGQSAGTKRFQAIEMFTSVVTSIIGGDNKLLTTCYRHVFRKCKIERPDGTMQQLNLPEHHRHCYRNNSVVPAPDAHLWHPIRLDYANT